MDRHETERLILRPQRLSDAPDLFAFLADPEAMRYTQCLPSLRECRRHIAADERQRRRIGCAMWTVLTKVDGRIVGRGGLYLDPFDPDWGIELAYHFAPAAWGRGYATELARFSLALARDRLGLEEVLAFAHPDNAASRGAAKGGVRAGAIRPVPGARPLPGRPQAMAFRMKTLVASAWAGMPT